MVKRATKQAGIVRQNATKTREMAAQLVADDRLTDREIAEQCGIDKATLERGVSVRIGPPPLPIYIQPAQAGPAIQQHGPRPQPKILPALTKLQYWRGRTSTIPARPKPISMQSRYVA